MRQQVSIFLLSSFLVGWSSFPEFESLTETEQERIDSPFLLNPEYQSDLLAYTKPLSWEYDWLTQDIAGDASIGSLSAVHFMTDNRIKLRKRLLDPLEFRFTGFEEKNFERQSAHYVLEFIYWPKEWLGLGIYGEPKHFKRDDDTGVALFLRPDSRHEIRFFQTFVDVTRLKRNDRSDTYLEPDLPYSRGVVGRVWSDPESGMREFLEYAFRWDTKTRWIFPDAGYEYQYSNLHLSMFGSKSLSEGCRLYSRVQWDRKWESRIPRAAPEPNGVRNRLFISQSMTWDRFGPNENWEFSPGFVFAYRQWRTDLGDVTYQDILPNASLRMPAFGEGKLQDHWEVGVDTNWHRAMGISDFFYRDEKDGDINSRLNLIYEIQFREANLRMMVTGDLDHLPTKRSWQGGCGQFRVFF